MSSLKLRALLGASALMAASALAAGANATTTINGGGSTLLIPYWTQAGECYDSDATNASYWLKGTPVTSVTPLAPTAAAMCAPTTGTIIKADAAGSGGGTGAVFAHDGTTTLFGTSSSGGEVFPTGGVQYGLSDNSLVAADLSVYNSGTTGANTYQGLTFTGTTAHTTGTNYPIPAAFYGALVQFPATVDPVALAYNPTYVVAGVSHTFNVQQPSADGSGGLKLDKAAYCGIFQGTITDWNAASLTALNVNTSGVGVSLTGGVSVPIKIVGRSDSSGTTSIFTRHLATVCGTGNLYGTAGNTTLPAAVLALSNFLPGSGSGGVASVINSNNGSIGYIGADYTLPANTKTGATSASLMQARLKNAFGNFEEPLASTALASFAGIHPPQSNTSGSGAYDSSVTANGLRTDPTAWVQSTAAGVPLSNPSAHGGYPIVGTTNFLGYTCYASASSVSALESFLQFGGGSQTAVILGNAALGQMPSEWQVAILNTFLEKTGDASSLKLYMDVAGTAPTNTNCKTGAPGHIVGG